MRKNVKKIISMMLLISILLMNVYVYAPKTYAAGYTWKGGDNITVTLKDNVLTVSGTGDMYSYDYIYANPPTSTAPWASYCGAGTNIKLVIESGVTSIGDYAFFYCDGLTGTLSIPDSVINIGQWAFAACSGLTGDLIISSKITTIKDYTFAWCSGFKGNLNIPKGVTSVGNYAFMECRGFKGSLILPIGLKNIEDSSFRECRGLTGDLNIPAGVTKIGVYAFSGCRGFKGTLNIPTGVTNLCDYAFYQCSGFTGDLKIPADVTNIKDSLFAGCTGFNGNLNIPAGVTSIGGMAFNGCSGFTGDLIIPTGVTSIGSGAFTGCMGFTGKLIFASGLTNIDTFAFSGCNGFTGNLSIPAGVTSIGQSAFEGCTGFRGTLEVPSSITSLGRNCFLYHNFGKVINYSNLAITLGSFTREWTDENSNTIYSITNGIAYRLSSNSIVDVFASISKTSCNVGDTIVINATATGGFGNYSYKYILHDKITGVWQTLKDYSGDPSYTWTAASIGDRDLIVEVTESSGKVIRSKAMNVVTVDPLKVTANANATSNYIGDKLTISATGSGGSGNYTYKFLVHNKDTDQWAVLQDYSDASSFTWTAESAGNRELFVEVKDYDGTMVRSNAMNVSTFKALTVTANATATVNKLGDKVTFTASATGGTGNYTYQFSVHNKDTDQWATLLDYSSTASFTCTLGSAGNREFYVDVKDSAGTVVRSTAMNVVTTLDTGHAIKLGDVTNDGAIDIYDILLLQRYISGTETISESLITAADVTNDKKVDIYDILAIQRHIMGIEIIVY